MVSLFSMTSCNKVKNDTNNDSKTNDINNDLNDNKTEESSNNTNEEKTDNSTNKKIEVSDNLDDDDSWEGYLF